MLTLIHAKQRAHWGLLVTSLSFSLLGSGCGPDNVAGLEEGEDSQDEGSSSGDASEQDDPNNESSEEDSGKDEPSKKDSAEKSEASESPEPSESPEESKESEEPSEEESTSSEGEDSDSGDEDTKEDTGEEDSTGEDSSGEDSGSDEGKDQECKVTAKWGTGKPFAAGTHVPNWEMEAVFDQNENGKIDEDERTPKKVTLEDVYCATPRNKFAIITFSTTL